MAGKTAGRRSGKPDTKQHILDVARGLFAQNGYDATSIRTVAEVAQVNPALVVYFFKNKHQLFIEAVLPIYNPMRQLPIILADQASTIPRRLAAFVAELLSDPGNANLATGLVRAATTNKAAATLLKESYLAEIGDTLAQNPGIKQPYIYANFISSQFIGVVTVRHILKLEPLASLTKRELEEELERRFQP